MNLGQKGSVNTRSGRVSELVKFEVGVISGEPKPPKTAVGTPTGDHA